MPNLDENGKKHPRMEINGNKRNKVDEYEQATPVRYGLVQ
jgi:hypothetical protein